MKTFIAMLLFTQIVHAKPIVVAVIDTGFDFKGSWDNPDAYKRFKLKTPKLCKFGHKDFVYNTEMPSDNHGHGTHIAGLIAQGNDNVDYCLVIMKYYDPKGPGSNNLENTIKAFQLAINIKVDIINYSGGGIDRSEKECSLMKQALDSGIAVFAAAGNERSDLDKHPYYPALCDNRIHVVESTNPKGVRLPSSNFSTAKYRTFKTLGADVLSLLPNNQYGFMTGTSQATARLTGKYLSLLGNKQKCISEQVKICRNDAYGLIDKYKYKEPKMTQPDSCDIESALRRYK